MLTLFYKSFIESVFSFCTVAWYGTLTLSNKNRLARQVAGEIIGEEQTCPTDIFYMHVPRKAQAILCTLDHPFCTELQMLPSGRRFTIPRGRTKRIKDSFVAVAIGSLIST